MSSNNSILFARAQLTTPGGINSPVRSFRSVGGTPRFITRAKGPYFWDADDKQYTDYVGSWGAAIVGHAHPCVIKAVQNAAELGLSFGAPTQGEIEIAEEICKLMPSMEQVRLVSSGTEATMSAIRLARGVTGREKIIKFEGCYHGHADSLLVKAGSGLLTFSNPTSAGVPKSLAKDTIVSDYNDIQKLEDIFKAIGEQIACIIIEPIAGNMNLVRATPEFLKVMRNLCTQYGTILIFDEVMSGFRVALGGAQALYNITPDITALGKIVGGGLPMAAFGGRKDLMRHIAPLGPVYQAGTLSGNPVTVAAGICTLRLIQEPNFYINLGEKTTRLTNGITRASKEAGISIKCDSVGGMFGLYFSKSVPVNYEEVLVSDQTLFNRFFHEMLKLGVYLAPSAFEVGFVSAQHSIDVVDSTIASASIAFSLLNSIRR